MSSRRLLVPEVIQTSAMDCGPASLKSLLEGLGRPVSYGRLREACQTDVDGTSIDTLEDLMVQLGLEAEQVLLPSDHLLLPEAESLPALGLIRLPTGFAHFVVIWARHGPLVQVMDPATGRRWPTARRFVQDLYPHIMSLPAEGWREWALSDEFLKPLGARLAQLGVKGSDAERLISAATVVPGPMGIATLDAATRMTEAMVSADILRRSNARPVVGSLFERARASAEGPERIIPEAYWTVRPAPEEEGQEPQVRVRGTVAVRVKGLKALAPQAGTAADDGGAALSPELQAALTEPPARPGHQLWSLVRQEPLPLLWAALTGLGLGAGAVVLQALLFRSLLDLGRSFGPPLERLGVLAGLLLFLGALALVELPTALLLKSLGRKLEARLRIAFFEKIPKLGDRYFRSRPSSDMAHRSHELHGLRLLPDLMGRAVRALVELGVTTAGILWLAPSSAVPALLACAAGVLVPLGLQPLLAQWDMRVRTHTGSLSLFYLDAFLGLVPIRTHAAARAVRAEHEGLLVEWSKAARSYLKAGVMAEGLQALCGFGLAAWLVTSHITHASDSSRVLLLIYWALNLPVLGSELTAVAREYPGLRNTTLRLLEPLGAREEEARTDGSVQAPVSGAEPAAVSVSLEKVTVHAAGHVILQDVDLRVAPGSHVAVIGPSGAGKSSLIGLLLGWHLPSTGELRVDGARLEAERLVALRRQTVWVDPATQLWNRSLLENLRYGTGQGAASLPRVLEQAELLTVLARMPEGLQTPLGEGGGMVSGGEGQRVRLGRAMLQEQVRMVVLDEPFRGLDRERRHRLMLNARELWKGKTLFCITHDVRETLGFERVLVIEGGRLVEDGPPAELSARPDSRYRALLDAEELADREIWQGSEWRRLRLEQGQLREEQPTRKTA
ncbi:ATP-binding cassette domain-containing protein [Hyalangium minutum]|uniref:Lipid A export ATP-binding/permease protein MsbA n=1 Tax=Hyalangium minutum TaxID=394096 RepID=A0A085WMG3_9BACT|nr:ATP-binding cassette domain-containing protein [Hyalangium minutum]KFE68876.1 hypothetical protein DB31_6778 [Hyalangium minutum]